MGVCVPKGITDEMLLITFQQVSSFFDRFANWGGWPKGFPNSAFSSGFQALVLNVHNARGKFRGTISCPFLLPHFYLGVQASAILGQKGGQQGWAARVGSRSVMSHTYDRGLVFCLLFLRS